jgi:hypothetical protein
MIYVAQLNKAIDYPRQQLGEGFMASDVFLTADGQSVAGYNSNPKASALFNQVTQFLTNALARSGFPPLNRYYMMDLADGKAVVVCPMGAYQWGMLIDTKKTTLGLLLNVVLPETMPMITAALNR